MGPSSPTRGCNDGPELSSFGRALMGTPARNYLAGRHVLGRGTESALDRSHAPSGAHQVE